MHPRHNRDICEPRCTSSKTMVLQSIFFIPLATEPTAGPQVRSSVTRSFKTEHKGLREHARFNGGSRDRCPCAFSKFCVATIAEGFGFLNVCSRKK